MKTVCIYHSIDLDGWMSAAGAAGFRLNVEQFNKLINDSHNI